MIYQIRSARVDLCGRSEKAIHLHLVQLQSNKENGIGRERGCQILLSCYYNNTYIIFY